MMEEVSNLCPTHVPFNALNVFFLPHAVEKMKTIDKEYESFRYHEDRLFSFQSKLDVYRKEIEAQMQAEMNVKVCGFLFVCLFF